MAAQKPKPYTITWPFTPKTAEDIDQTFDILFRQVQLNAPGAGVLPVFAGGTGLGAFTKGDLLYADTSSTIAGLHDIATGNVLLSGGVNTAPAYGKVGLTTHVSGVLPEANGGTNQSTYAQGDLIYASAANTLAKLAKNTTATRYLSNTGASNAPAWAQVDLTTGVTGTLPATSGGTGHITYAVGDLLYANTTTALARLADVATGNALISGGVNTAPSWGKIADAHITDVTEAKITDGTILARVADIETITGNWIITGDWTFTGAPVFEDAAYVSAIPLVRFIETDASANNARWRLIANSETFALQTLTDNEVTANSVFIVTRSGATVSTVTGSGAWSLLSTLSVTGQSTFRNATDTISVRPPSGSGGSIKFTEDGVADRWAIGINAGLGVLDFRFPDIVGTLATRWESNGSILHQFGFRLSGSQDVTLAAGNNNNVSLNAGTVMLRVTTAGVSANIITGLTGGASGRIVKIFRVAGTQSCDIAHEDANSTAANRFTITGGFSIGSDIGLAIFYDGTSSRWRIQG
jgi:hypothetical protein